MDFCEKALVFRLYFVFKLADDHAGWRPYRAEFRVTPVNNQVWVAVGLSVVWETLVWFPMDDVKVCVEGRCHRLLLPFAVKNFSRGVKVG